MKLPSVVPSPNFSFFFFLMSPLWHFFSPCTGSLMASLESFPLSEGTCAFTLTLRRGWLAHFSSLKWSSSSLPNSSLEHFENQSCGFRWILPEIRVTRAKERGVEAATSSVQLLLERLAQMLWEQRFICSRLCFHTGRKSQSEAIFLVKQHFGFLLRL